MRVADLLTVAAVLPLPQAARAYAVAGVPVFPCVPGGKRPLTEHGFHDASTDVGRVDRWWARWPAANVALPTGAVSGVEVVDVDVHPGGSGFDEFERARRAGLVEGWAALVRTPSGGVHAYYPADPGRVQPSWQAARAHVDFRGAGGYIIAPPSLVDAGGQPARYELIATAQTTEPGPVRASVLRELLDPRPVLPPPGRRPPGGSLDVERLAVWVSARGEGERNRGLFWASCRLAEAGLAPGEMHAALGPAAEHAGLPAGEVTATIHSAYRATHTRPAPAGTGQPAAAHPVARRGEGRLLA